MPQGALLEGFIYPPVICLAKGDLARSASVTLMTVAAVAILEHARGLT
jgi:hypothetical protein